METETNKDKKTSPAVKIMSCCCYLRTLEGAVAQNKVLWNLMVSAGLRQRHRWHSLGILKQWEFDREARSLNGEDANYREKNQLYLWIAPVGVAPRTSTPSQSWRRVWDISPLVASRFRRLCGERDAAHISSAAPHSGKSCIQTVWILYERKWKTASLKPVDTTGWGRPLWNPSRSNDSSQNWVVNRESWIVIRCSCVQTSFAFPHSGCGRSVQRTPNSRPGSVLH